jgi:hypothetical protein
MKLLIIEEPQLAFYQTVFMWTSVLGSRPSAPSIRAVQASRSPSALA